MFNVFDTGFVGATMDVIYFDNMYTYKWDYQGGKYRYTTCAETAVLVP